MEIEVTELFVVEIIIFLIFIIGVLILWQQSALNNSNSKIIDIISELVIDKELLEKIREDQLATKEVSSNIETRVQIIETKLDNHIS